MIIMLRGQYFLSLYWCPADHFICVFTFTASNVCESDIVTLFTKGETDTGKGLFMLLQLGGCRAGFHLKFLPSSTSHGPRIQWAVNRDSGLSKRKHTSFTTTQVWIQILASPLTGCDSVD